MPPEMVEMLFTNPNLGLKFQPKVKPVLGIVGLPRGILEIGGNPLPTVKPRLFPLPKMNPDIGTNGLTVGILKIGKIVEGRDVMSDIPQREHLMSEV
jgi:hypothetical protein